MADIAMCKYEDCPHQDNCWRLLAPPNQPFQSYYNFRFDHEGFESGKNNGCEDYIATDELIIR